MYFSTNRGGEGFKHQRMKDNNVEIGNPTFMYEPQVNEDDDGDLIDTPFTLDGEKVSSEIKNK